MEDLNFTNSTTEFLYDEVFYDAEELEVFTFNDLFNVIAYTVMSLGKYTHNIPDSYVLLLQWGWF